MLECDEEMLECDLAETYHIYDYRELPLKKVALFSAGLREDSRIKMKLHDMNYTLKEILLACIVDRLSYLVWSKTEEGRKGKNRPSSITSKLLDIQDEKKKDDILAFSSGEEFEKMRNKILGKEVI